MNKISLIIKREYLSRVRKRSFLLLTIIGPILFAALMISPILIMKYSKGDNKTIAVLDETTLFDHKFQNNDETNYLYFGDSDLETLKTGVQDGLYDAVLYIPKPDVNVPAFAELYSNKQISMNLISNMKNDMNKEIEYQKMMASGIDPVTVKSIKADIIINSIRFNEDGSEKKSFAEFEYLLGIILAIMIYFFILTFSGQVMQGVIEEKASRIIEVIISSVKPFQLMMGKIIGIGLVGLTQFLLWAVLTGVLYGGFTLALGSPTSPAPLGSGTVMSQQADVQNMVGNENIANFMEIINSINFGGIIVTFLLFFIGGYILFASLMAAIGGAVDNNTDAQQFTMPLTIPLIIGIVASNYIANSPDGSLSFWLSIIPFTSPVAMLVRIPFGVPYWQIILSLVLLYGTFMLCTWMAAKIYRTGILMYGKKITYKEIWKWLKY